ncbi:ABC transporter substrate-binding protein [Clostridium oceanicum]|uniref:ABC transporter substrate-binding protein n=1 Tax=Clostridium oceanicum TaxID=1543 RepID=A0ABN1JLU8_9CLOT
MKKMKLIISTILMVSIMGLFFGCASGSKEKQVNTETTSKPKKGGTIVVADKMTPPHLDSDKSTDWAISAIMNHVYEGLFEFDENYKVQPHLAESYTLSKDGKVYDVKLRKGVLFQNNKEMTTEDVKASFERWLKNNDIGINVKPYFDKVNVKGKYEIEFKFKEVYAPFINIIASPVSNQKLVIRPKEEIDKYGDNIMKEFIGTGPYKLVKYVPDKEVELKRFEKYVPDSKKASGLSGKRVAYADNLVFKFVSEQETRISGVKTGEFLFAEEAPQDRYSVLKDSPDVEPIIVKPDGMEMLMMNCGSAPFNNKKARQALAYGIDLKELASSMVGDEKFWSLEGCLANPGSTWYDKTAGKGIYGQYNIKKAKQLLKESGYDGTPIVILNGQDDKVEKQGAVALKSQLEKIGFKVKLALYDRPTVVEKRSKVKGWNLHLSYFCKVSPDPQIQSAWTGTNAWISNWNDEDSKHMDDIFKSMMRETNLEKRKTIVKDFYKEMWKSVPHMNLVDYSRMHVINNKLKGYKNGVQPFFWNTWIEE